MADSKTKIPAKKAASPKARRPDLAGLKSAIDIAAEYRPTQMVALLHRFQSECNAKVTQRAGACQFSLYGLSSKRSPSDIDAMTNWLNAARRAVRTAA